MGMLDREKMQKILEEIRKSGGQCKICPQCKQSNNPAFNNCWNCNYFFGSGRYYPYESLGLLKRIAESLFFMTGILVLFAVAYQVHAWWQNGKWSKYPLMDFLDSYTRIRDTGFYAWFIHPDSWQGLHPIVSFLFSYPIVLFGLGVGIVRGLDLMERVIDKTLKWSGARIPWGGFKKHDD